MGGGYLWLEERHLLARETAIRYYPVPLYWATVQDEGEMASGKRTASDDAVLWYRVVGALNTSSVGQSYLGNKRIGEILRGEHV